MTGDKFWPLRHVVMTCWTSYNKAWYLELLYAGVVICLERGQTCIWPSWCHCHSLSLASVKSRLVLSFWYRLTRVVLEKGPLNGCVCIVSYSMPSLFIKGYLTWRRTRPCRSRAFIPQSLSHRARTGNEKWSHRYICAARWPLENNRIIWWAQVLRTEI